MNANRTGAFLVTALTITVGGCGHQQESVEPTPTPVRVHVVGLAAAENGVRYSATINPYEQVELGFKVSGYIREILQVRDTDGRPRTVEQGDLVRKGTVLARVRESDHVERVNQVKAQLTRAEVSVEKAQHAWERATHLFSTQSLTKPDYDSAKAQLASAQANVAGERARLQDVQLTLQDCALIAPLDGVVLQRRIEVGSLAAPGVVGFVLANLSQVKAVFGVPDTMLTHLQPGTSLTIVTEALRGEKFPGRITAIAPSADTRSRVFNVEVTVPNPHSTLKAGMIASLEVHTSKPRTLVTVVPISAIIRAPDNQNGYAVFVVEEHNGARVARLRTVEIGNLYGNTIAVTTGLKAGEHILVTGTSLVSEGEMVRIVP